MAWTTPSDHSASLVTVDEWNDFHGTSGNCAYLKAIADAPMKAKKDGGATVGGRQAINFVSGAGMTITVADDSGNNEIDVTLAASGGSSPTQSEGSGPVSYTTAAGAGTKGAWQELIASSGFACTHVAFAFKGAATGRIYCSDIGTGAAESEVVKIADVTSMCGAEYVSHYVIPFTIAASSRISIRTANETNETGDTVYAAITLLG